MKELLKNTSLFENLNDSELTNIADIAIQRSYPAGTELFKQGDSGDTFYVVISGSVKVFNITKDGQEKIIAIFRSGQSFGEFALIDGEPRSASATTMEDSVFIIITRETFFRLLKKNFSLSQKLIELLVKRLRRTNEQVMDLVFLDARTQTIKTLITLANEHGQREEGTVKLNVPVTPAEIASLAGIPQDMAEEVIRELLHRQVLIRRHNFYYLNTAALLNK
ncbi:Crp/Fnr family transcriptional regulator [Brevibacillus dissolubilis]|uniref:Crp/Fnr family transcriptional regulator n=1 Tax=Brevibacillus dissolubilis TaxID=1844116 RepID=UPI0011164D6E|nr:Crp/Fnr family transcriptional regulator [Brevibacillus dissolubilis]